MAQCIIGGCTDLITCLENAKQGTPGSEYIELGAGLFDAAGELADALLLQSLTVTQLDANTPLIQPKAPCVWIVGKAVLFPSGPSPQVEYSVQISAEVSGSDVTLLMDATPLTPSTWSFAANFAPFPYYYGYSAPQLSWLPSFYNGIVINQPHFRVSTAAQGDYPQGLSFGGLVDLTKGSLASLGGYFPDADSVSLHGPVTLRAGTYPALDITGDLPNYSIPQLGELSLSFGTKDAGADPAAEPAASTLLLVGTTIIGSFPTVNLSAPILEGSFVWVITGEVENKKDYTLAAGLQALVSYVNNQNLPLPSGLDTLGFFLDLVTVSIVPGTSPTIDMIGFRVASVPDKSWSAPIFGLSISDLYVEWQVISPFGNAEMQGVVGGILHMGSGSTATQLDIQVSVSGINSPTATDVAIFAALDPDYPVPLAPLFEKFTGIEIDLNLAITEFLFEAHTGPRTLQFTTQLDGTWPFPVPLVEFGQTRFFFLYTPNSVTGSASMRVSITSFDFLVSAAYAGKGQGWQFAGQLAPDTQGRTLQDFVDNVTGNQYPNLPGNLGAITLEKFFVSFDTGTGAFAFDGALSWPFVYDDFFDVTLDAEMSLQSPGPPPGGQRKYSGFVSGKLSVNAFSVGVVYSFDLQSNTTITFTVQYGGVSINCSFTKDPKTGDRILKANLGGVTFGGIVEYLVNLVDPTLNFSLPSPWDVLNQISFDNLILTVNLTTKAVGVSYKLGQDLGIVDIDTIGLTYVNKAGRSTVDISITGRFFDQQYPETNPLSWDLLNDPPPTPPGQGPEFLDLRYLGVGQNVGFRDARSFDNVQAVIKALESDFLPAGSDDQNPLLSPILDTLKFTGDGHWLIGVDLTFIGAISISVVFNDPVLYGLRVALSGDKVKSFSGLDFQILYKKVTDTIGVYHIVLTLPEAFRQLQFGAVAVTLPTVKLDIYTNGNFRIDMGFPVGLDFSQSFCVQAGPFIGYGGFYFALLDGATSERVPKVTNGSFGPVIEAGLALSVGLGRTFDKGVLSAGVSVTCVAVVEGVFGWFNPDDRSAGSSLYYLIQGTAALVGKLYGTVNFVVVQASVNVTAYAQVTLTIEAYQPILIELKVGVSVSVSVKILFIRVHFSFSMTLELSFTIGSAGTPPWTLDASQPPSLMLRQQTGSYYRRRLSGARLQRKLLPSLGQTGTFDWKPRRVFHGVQTVELSLVPSLTVALPEAVLATHAALGATGAPQHQVVMSLYAPNSIPPEARAAREVRAVNLPDAAETPFNLLVSGMLAWSLTSYTRPPGETLPPPSVYTLASDLDAISEYLADPNNWQSAFTYDALAAFMELNYLLRIQTPLGPSGLMQPDGTLAAAGATGSEVSAAIFPMIPELEMGPKGLAPVQFWNYNCVSREYEDALTSYYQQLQVNSGVTGAGAPPQERAVTNFRTEPGAQGCAGGDESLSTFIFRDYFAMVAKGAVSGASDLLKAYPYEPTGANGLTGPTGPAESLHSIADEFNGVDVQYVTRPGDTLGTIAGRYGLSPRRLQVVNPHVAAYGHREPLEPGTTLAVNTGVTPDAIVKANPSYPLQFTPWDPVFLTLSGVKHQVKAGTGGVSESLTDICAQYGLSGPTGPGSLFTFEEETVPPSNPNATNTSLLQPGAQMTIPAQTFTVASPVDDSAELVAAFFFVRSLGPARPDQMPWYSYAQFYEQWMEDNPGATGPTGPAVWDVPVVTIQQDGSLIVSGTGQYAPQGAEGAGLLPDTRELAAGYFAMTQLTPAPFGDAFLSFAAGYVSPTGPSGSYAVSDFPYTVPAGATMGGVAELFGVGLDELAYVNAGATGMLQPLAVVALPTLEYPIAEGDTFGSVAARFDLTLDELADSVEDNVGILEPYAAGATGATPLTIPDVPGRAAETLVEDMVNFGRFNDVSGMVTNFLLHGMRVPEPGAQSGATFPPGATMWGLYEMTGQQFPVPSGVTGPSGQFEVRFTKGAPASWVCLDSGLTGPTAPTGPAACGDELVVYLDPGFFADPPSLVLDPEILAGPAALPLYRDTQRQYSISENIHWQSAGSPELPGPTGGSGAVAGQPSIWNFPQTLLSVAQQGPSGPTGAAQYELMLADPDDPTGASDLPISSYAWASAVDIRVQRVPAAGPGQYMPNTYALLGADQQGRDQLLSAWTFLQDFAPPYGQLFILYPPSATSNNSKGLASDSLDPVQTFLLKTNLTTVTRSNQGALLLGASQQPSGDFYARLGAIPDFVRLAWEASVTGSGGFYMNYYNANGGGGLPETLFADGDTATVTLLLLTAQQDNPWAPDLGLYPFNNCAVVGDNIDPASSRLYVAALAPDPVRVATVPAGHAGFYLARVNPDPSGDDGPTPPEDQTRNLYNLTGYQVTGNDYFGESNQGLPVGPADEPVEGVSGPTGPGVWWYQQVLPLYKFGKVNDTPDSAALPAASANPYAGLTGASGSAGPLSGMDISLDFYDVYGNSTLSTAGQLGVTGPIGYTDDLIGVSSWPAAGADFAFLPGPTSGVVLDTRLSMQLDKYSPTESYPFAQSSEAAAADATRYTEVFYQVQQRDLAFDLRTNLGDALIAPDELKASMMAFVSKAKVFADACASQSQREYVTKDGDWLGDIAAAYSVTPSMLVAENQNAEVAPIFKGRIVQPVFAVAGPMNTLTLLAAGQPSLPYPPTCGAQGVPDCAGDDAPQGAFSVVQPGAATGSGAKAASDPTAQELTPTELLTNNQSVPLTPGIVLRTEPRVDALPAGTANTLAAAAVALQCVVYAVVQDTEGGVTDPAATVEIGLYADNFSLAGVVAPDLDITIDGVTVNTGQTPTFESVETAFASLGLDRGDFVVKLENVTGIFAPAAVLTHADFVVPQPPPSQAGPALPVFNITDLPASCGTLDFLAGANRAVANFFYTGSALYMSACCYQPQPFDTFASLAEQFNHITLDHLTQYNTASPLKGGVSLAIPALTYLGDPAAAYAPYTPTSDDSLDTIATTFGTTAPMVAAINRYLPGIFAEGATLTLPRLYYLSPLDSLQSAADIFGMDFDMFISAIAGLTGLYRTNGVVITPLPTVPDEVNGKKASFADVAGLFNVKVSPNSDPVTQLLTVNRSLEGFLLDGAVLAGPSPAVPVTAGAHDTVGTILSRFQREQGIEVSIKQLADANASTSGLLTTGRQFLLPPNPTEVTSALAPVIPPEGATGEAAIVFPVSVGVDMARPLFLVAPDFQVAPAVYQNASEYSPRGMAPGATTMNLSAFATEFEAAFTDYHLKCAVVQKDAVSDPQQAPQLYAVNFGETGVRRCAVDATAPQFYALAPLSTELLTGTLPIRPYVSGCGLGNVVYKKFDTVDLDNWMGQFLNTVDLFLSAPYAVPAFQLGGGGPSGAFVSTPEVAPAIPADGPVGLGGYTGAASPEGFFRSVSLGATGGGCTGGTGADGPSNYDDIVASKYQLAGELKTDVVQILLQGAGPTGGYYEGAAQETLYQQMLVRLSDAYTVNAVVQYAVDVESPLVTPADSTGASGPIPPRLSGQVVPDLYAAPQTPPGPSGNCPPVPLQVAAPYFGVSVPYLAETIGGMHGLLQAGATAQYNTKSYVIKSSDTLNVVAEQLDVPADPTLPGYWEAWTPFANDIATQALVVAGGIFSVVKIAREVYEGDTLETVAEFFGTDPATVGEANQSLAGIFNPGDLAISGYETYSIQLGDTLLSIAAGVKPAGSSPPLTVATLSDYVSSMKPLLKVGETLYLTQALPDVTLSTAKVSLGRVGDPDGLAPPLSFLFSLKHPRQYRKLFLNLKYVVNEMEFGIDTVPDTGGYQSSSWLTFVLPIGSGQGADVGVETTMSQVQIPVPLRSYPVPPTLVAQSGLPTGATAQATTPEQAIAQGKLWDYRFDFQSTNAAQDSNHVQVSFNLFGGANGAQLSALPPARRDAVFGALAEFIDASPSLVADLALLTKQPNQTAAIAVSVLDTFAASVAAALGYNFFGAFLGEQWPTLTYLYKLQSFSANDELAELQMTLESGPTGPGGGVLWPQVFIQSLTAPTAGEGPDAGWLPLTRFGPTAGTSASFSYPSGFPVNAPITQRFLLEERDVIQNQNASGGIYLTRNDDLIASGPLGTTGPSGPTGPQGAVATNEAFLYETPLVSFINYLTPFISDQTKIDVSALSGPSGPTAPPRTLAQHIENMLDAVLELGPQSPVQADSEISILCSYGFPISGAGGDGELVAVTPIRLVPAQALTPETKTEFAYQLSESILGWPGWPAPAAPAS